MWFHNIVSFCAVCSKWISCTEKSLQPPPSMRFSGFQQSVLNVGKSFLFLLLCQNTPFLLRVYISKRDIQWMFGQSKISPCQPLPPCPLATIFKYISTKGELLLTSSDIKTERVFLSVNPSYKQSERSFNGCQNAKASKRWRKHYTRSFTVHSLAVVMNAN